MQLYYINDSGDTIQLNSKGAGIVVTKISGLYGTQTKLSFSGAEDENVYVGSSVTPKEITLEGFITMSTAAQREQLLKVIKPQGFGHLYVNRGGSVRRIGVRTAQTPYFSGHTGKAFTMRLVSPSPYFESVTGDLPHTLIGWQGGITFPFEIVDTFTFAVKGNSESVNIINDGDAPCGFTVRVPAQAEVKYPKITNTATGEFIRLHGAVEAGDELVINCYGDDKSLTIIHEDGTVENAMPKIDPESTFFRLRQGDNIIRVTCDDGEEWLQATLTMRTLHLSA